LRKYRNDFKAIEQEINGKLPWVTSVGLAVAFEESRKRHERAENIFRIVFLVTIVAMLGVFFWGANKNGLFFDELSTETVLMRILKILPLEAPLIWLGWIASKRIKQEARLHEEYQYKWSVAYSFEGFRQQVRELDEKRDKEEVDETGTHANRLFTEVMKTLTRNPSNIIDTRDDNAPWERYIPWNKNKTDEAEKSS
jgi:hypothetical protein